MRMEKIVLNEERNVTLTVYLQEVGGEFRYMAKRPGIMVIPGGGYQFCSDREADPVALPYLKAGFQAFILRYSVKEDAVWPNPLEDYEQAMSLIRSKAEEWGVYGDKMAVVGFSAGGHLAAAAASMAKNRPNAAILGYAVTGADVRACNRTAPDIIPAVDRNTCPCFLFATRTDNVVDISNSIRFMQALADHDIAFESHIYAYGPHGFSTADTSVQNRDSVICGRVSGWVEDSIGWLKDVLGDFGEDGMTEPVCKRHVTADGEAFLSIDCTFAHLMGNPAAGAVIENMLETLRHRAAQTGAQIPDIDGEMAPVVAKMKLRDMLSYVGAPEEFMNIINEKLVKLPNI